jgi:hypothetical protein
VPTSARACDQTTTPRSTPAAIGRAPTSATKRGIVSERRVPPNATLKIKQREQEEEREHPIILRKAKAG